MPKQEDFWFPAKRYGYGWGLPIRWQGWVTLLAWSVATAIAGVTLLPRRPGLFLVVMTATTTVLILIGYLKGEPPRWQWGDDSRQDKR
jgi:hypothetical protein